MISQRIVAGAVLILSFGVSSSEAQYFTGLGYERSRARAAMTGGVAVPTSDVESLSGTLLFQRKHCGAPEAIKACVQQAKRTWATYNWNDFAERSQENLFRCGDYELFASFAEGTEGEFVDVRFENTVSGPHKNYPFMGYIKATAKLEIFCPAVDWRAVGDASIAAGGTLFDPAAIREARPATGEGPYYVKDTRGKEWSFLPLIGGDTWIGPGRIEP